MEKTIQDVTSGLSQTTQTELSEAPNSTPVINGQSSSLGVASKPRQPARRRLIFMVVGVLLILALLGLVATFLFNAERSPQEVSRRFQTIQIPLDDFLSGEGLSLLGTRNLAINGRLQANDAFIISPSAQPTNSTAGQIYYDQTSNELAYYNGSQFITLPGSLAAGDGIANVGGQLNNTGVLSLQGQTGNLSLTSGAGIAVDGTTLTNTGVLSLGGATGDIALGSGLAMSNNELRSTGVNSLTAGTVNLTITNDGAGNLTISDVGGGGGTVTSSGGTNGRIAKFTGLQNIEDSLLSESGSTITVNGDLSITGTTTLTNPLTVGNGGTGATSLASNGVVISHGTGAFTSVAAGAAGQCLVSTVGAPTWSSCGSGVTSLNGLNGALTLANSTGVGTTITIDDASTTQKGIAQYNATNFSTSAGVVNTIQNIHSGASPSFVGLTLSGDLAVNGGDLTSTGALTITPGGTLVAGATSQTLTLQGGAATTFSATSGANTTTLSFETPAANVTYRLPTAGSGTYDVCTTAGNCSGVGGGVTTPGGSINRLAKFSSAQGIADSTITDNGSTVSTTVDLIVQGGDVTVGVASTQTGTINLAHSASGFLGTITQGALTANRTYTLPNASGEFCMTSGNCSGSGSSNTLQAAYDAGNSITTSTGRDIDITLADTATDSNFDLVVADGSTSFVSFARANGAGTADPAQMVLIENQDTDRALPIGLKIQSAAGGMTTGLDVSDAEIATALSAGDNNIVGGTGNIDLTNFDVVGSTGSITTAGDLAVNGGDITSSGALTITPGGTFIVGVDGQDATLRGAVTTITSSGAGNDVVINSADTIVLQDNTSVAGNLTITGTTPEALVVKASTNGSGALAMNVQQSDSDSIMRLTDDGTLAVGNSTGITGIVALGNGAGGDFAEIRTNITTSTIYQLPEVGGGTVVFCTSGGNCGAATGTLQAAYGYSTGGTTPEIKLDTIRNGLDIQDANSTIGSGQNFISLRGPNASTLGTIMFGVGTQGNLFMQPGTERTDYIDINNSSGNLLTLDSINSRLGLALTSNILPTHTLDVNGATNLRGAGTGDSLTVSNATSSGNVLVLKDNTTTVASIADGGLAMFQNSSDSTTAFRILNAGTVPQFVVDTTNSRAYIGNPTADSTGALLVLDTKNNTGDPTGVDGGMYYNSLAGTFRCYENGAWSDCIGIPKPNTARTSYLVANGQNATWAGYGDILTNTGPAGSGGSISSNFVPSVFNDTLDSIGSAAGVAGNDIYEGNRIVYQTHLDPSSTSVRIWAGLTTETLATMAASATPAGSFAAFRYDTGASDATWKCVTRNGTSATVTDSSIAIGNDQKFEIVLDQGIRAVFKINGQVVCNVTATVPDSIFRVVNSITALNAGFKSIYTGWIYVQDDPTTP